VKSEGAHLLAVDVVSGSDDLVDGGRVGKGEEAEASRLSGGIAHDGAVLDRAILRHVLLEALYKDEKNGKVAGVRIEHRTCNQGRRGRR
jgi:hypothetical protein